MSSHRRRFLGFPFMFVLACSSDPQDSSSGDAAVEAGATDAAQASDVVLGTDGPLLQDGGGTAPADASTDGGPLCTTVGWCRLTGTKLTSVQPSPLPEGTFAQLVGAWSGGAADVERNRLYVWGGGHADYSGNEVYALDLDPVKLRRLNQPSPDSAHTACDALYSDGLPSSRHSYDGLTFLPATNELYAFGGSKWKCGFTASDVLRFSVPSLQWSQRIAAMPGVLNGPGYMADFDAASGKIFLHDAGQGFSSYDPATNSVKVLSSGAVDYHMTGRIDPVRKLFVMMGGGEVRVVSLANGTNYAVQDWDNQTTGCSALRDAPYPGLAFDTSSGVLVGWVGGGDVYKFDPTTKTCTKVTFPGGPPNATSSSAAQPNGTMGRFRYFPKLKVFAVINSVDEDAFTLRIGP